MHARDRELLAGLSKVNSKIGNVTVELLSVQADDAGCAADYGARRADGADRRRSRATRRRVGREPTRPDGADAARRPHKTNRRQNGTVQP